MSIVDLPKLTLLVLTIGDKIILGRKKTGFGKGNYNGYGGKLESAESLRDCMCRETLEEGGITLDKPALKLVAIHTFLFPHKSEWNQQVFVYKATSYEGKLVETDEMEPFEFPIDAIPFDKMWDDDKYWLEDVIAGKKLRTSFTFNKEGKVIEKKILEVKVLVEA